MIITRNNKSQAYLVFAANGDILLNKKPVGTWRRRLKRKFTEDFRFYQNVPVLTASVNIQTRSGQRHKYLENGKKLNLMQMVAAVIPDNMLPNAHTVS